MISGADTITVTTTDGTEYEASVVGSYEDGDIAVLKIEAEGDVYKRQALMREKGRDSALRR